GLDLGDQVELSSEHGTARFRVVGETLFPEGDFEHDSGVALTLNGAERVLGDVHDNAQLHGVGFTWAEEVDPDAADRSLVDAGFQVFSGTSPGVTPPDVVNLGEVRTLPVLLALVVLVLGLLTLLHAVSLNTRLRASEAGTLRALGVTRRVVVAVVEAHGVVLAGVAMAIGTPLGLAAGRKVWSQIAGRANVIDHPVAPLADIGCVAIAIVIGSTVLAAPLALRAVRQRAVLRAE
ncbi:MAG: FtsX-like permease family protein, partial [Acidimicrobiales bacterium]